MARMAQPDVLGVTVYTASGDFAKRGAAKGVGGEELEEEFGAMNPLTTEKGLSKTHDSQTKSEAEFDGALDDTAAMCVVAMLEDAMREWNPMLAGIIACFDISLRRAGSAARSTCTCDTVWTHGSSKRSKLHVRS